VSLRDKGPPAFQKGVGPKPAFTLVPITPARLAEKRTIHDFFFAAVLNEGVALATED